MTHMYRTKLYSDGNNMDPGTVPPLLQGLTQVEEMLISSVIPMMSVYKLPHGQIGYGGHIINLPQDVSRFVSTLPRHPSDLDFIVVRKATASGTHKDFRVRRSRVQHALQWLIKNNSYYSATVLDNTVLAELPEDGDLPSPSVVTRADETEDSDILFSNTSVDTKFLPTFRPCYSGLLQGEDSDRSGTCLSYTCEPHQLQSLFARDLSVGVGPARLVVPSCLLRAATQHPGSSSPASLLRRSSAGVIWMWMASLSNSSLGCLAMSTTAVSSHLMVWWSFHACSATADFSSVPFRQASWCSLSLVSSLLLVSPM